MLENFLQPHILLSLLTLTLLEVVLGIDNLVFIAVLSNRLPSHQQKKARRYGLLAALLTRLALLAIVNKLAHLTEPLFILNEQAFSGRSLILILGGLFLLVKSTHEIHVDMTAAAATESTKIQRTLSFGIVILQIMLLDIIFSLDSIFTAIGLAQNYAVMALAIIIAVIVMMCASEFLSRLINRYPSLKMLALSFLLLIGVVLLAEGFGLTIPHAYLYFAITFSLFVETMNIIITQRKAGNKVLL